MNKNDMSMCGWCDHTSNSKATITGTSVFCNVKKQIRYVTDKCKCSNSEIKKYIKGKR